MADTPTPRRKPATKRKTTARKPAPKKPAAVKEPTLQEMALAQAQAKVDTYNALKDAGLPIPADLRAEVEAAQPLEAQKEESTKVFARNTHNSVFRFKLQRHERGDRGIVLQARGTRGDLQPLKPDDLDDPNLIANVRSGYLELLSEEQARNVVVKQTTNQQSRHPALAALLNPEGQPYAEGSFSVAPNPDEAAITVAKLDDGQIAFDRTGIANRVREPGEAPGTPSYIQGAEPQHAPANEQAAYLSDLRQDQKKKPQRSIGGNPAILSDGFNPES